MALSDWCISCWNRKGEPTIARLRIGENILVEVVENYVKIVDKNSMRNIARETRFKIYKGLMKYGNLLIYVDQIQDPQYGIFFYIYDIPMGRLLTGISVQGFHMECIKWEGNKCEEWEEEWVGIKDETFKKFKEWIQKIQEEAIITDVLLPEPPEIKEKWYYNQGTLALIEEVIGQLSQEELRDKILKKALMGPIVRSI